jgi:hypothetical protein
VFRIALQPGSDAIEDSGMKSSICKTAQYDGIVAPDNPLVSQPVRETLKIVDTLLERIDRRFQERGVVEKGIEKVISMASFIEFAEILKKIGGIAGPEYDCLHVSGYERNPGNPVRVEGIGNEAISFPDTVHEPLRIEGRYICPPACAYNHVKNQCNRKNSLNKLYRRWNLMTDKGILKGKTHCREQRIKRMSP